MRLYGWELALALGLGINAALGFGYRVYRLTKGGPLGDVIGQAILGLVLAGLAGGVAADQSWARWGALIYGLLFGVAVMPVWVLAVLIPSDPQRVDYAFTAIYWATLLFVIAAAVLW
ncbi:MAG TPA: hypothetical protein VG408_06880 [Actinomycetota bacterium]|nr:hypothetical protein [Actinomycetota bacterium]